jgi:prevent-host-death family protein
MGLDVTEVRRRILSLIDELPEEGIVITKRGEPIARLMSIKHGKKRQYVSEAILAGKSKPGPLCPKDENPYDLLFD